MTAVAGNMNGVDAAQLTGKMGAMQEIQNMLGSINLTQLFICSYYSLSEVIFCMLPYSQP